MTGTDALVLAVAVALPGMGAWGAAASGRDGRLRIGHPLGKPAIAAEVRQASSQAGSR